MARYLDKNNREKLRLFLYSTPQEALARDYVTTLKLNRKANYTLKHFYVYWDDSWENIQSGQDFPYVYMKKSGIDGNEPFPSESVFEIPLNKMTRNGMITADLYNLSKDTSRVQSIYPDQLIGLGTQKIEQPGERLHSNPEMLEMSDVVIGYKLDSSFAAK